MVALARAGGCKFDCAAAKCRISLNGVFVTLPGGEELLGVAHLHRGYKDTLSGKRLPQNITSFGHHYTHFFFTISSAPPFEVPTPLRRVLGGGRSGADRGVPPLLGQVRRVGSEFCIGSLPRQQQQGGVFTGRSAPASASRGEGGESEGTSVERSRGLDCEVIQYVTGMMLQGQALTLTFGVNDCTARRAELALSDVLHDLLRVAPPPTEPSVVRTDEEVHTHQHWI